MHGSDCQTEITASYDEPAATIFRSPTVRYLFSAPRWFHLASHCYHDSTCRTPTIVRRVPKSGIPRRKVWIVPLEL
jgi:hypothetical protein